MDLKPKTGNKKLIKVTDSLGNEYPAIIKVFKPKWHILVSLPDPENGESTLIKMIWVSKPEQKPRFQSEDYNITFFTDYDGKRSIRDKKLLIFRRKRALK